ncbi:MAG: hypothetical protein OEY66_07245 [Gammaproteobacteria bacterium]|nr:hypothetical protein [Gammaproteobacteria bacterium]
MDTAAKLPTYKSNATPEQREQKLKWMHEQIKFIKLQEKDNIPLVHTKIRCGCLKLVNYLYMYRCLYCGVFYCKECAEEHFGYKVA